MPTDTKRLAVPEKTIPYQFYLPAKKIPANPLNEKNLRQDGRQAEEMRPIFIKTKVVTRAKGSVYLESGDTKVSRNSLYTTLIQMVHVFDRIRREVANVI